MNNIPQYNFINKNERKPSMFQTMLDKHENILNKYKDHFSNGFKAPNFNRTKSNSINLNPFDVNNNDIKNFGDDIQKRIDIIMGRVGFNSNQYNKISSPIQKNKTSNELSIENIKAKYLLSTNNNNYTNYNNYINNIPLQQNDEIEKIKLKYLTKSKEKKTKYESNIDFLEEKLNHYKDIINKDNGIEIKKEKINLIQDEKEKNFKEVKEDNDNSDKNDKNEILISKPSFFDSQIGNSLLNSFNYSYSDDNERDNNNNNNGNVNSDIQEEGNDYSNMDQVNYKEESNGEQNDYNYDEVMPIVNKVSQLKEIYYEDENSKAEAQAIVSNVLDRIPDNIQSNEEDNDIGNNFSRPKLLSKRQSSKGKHKRKLISFEEFLEQSENKD